MVQLSRRGWNNVLIFFCLGFILVFSKFGKQESTIDQAHTTLLPASTYILSLKTKQWRIERLGNTWRSVPDLGLSMHQMDKYMLRWQGLKLMPGESLSGLPQTIHVWLAGYDEPLVVRLYQDNDRYALENWQGRWFTLTAAEYRGLLKPG